MTSEWLFNSFIPPKNLYPPKQISGYAPAYDVILLVFITKITDILLLNNEKVKKIKTRICGGMSRIADGDVVKYCSRESKDGN